MSRTRAQREAEKQDRIYFGFLSQLSREYSYTLPSLVESLVKQLARHEKE